MSTTHSSLFTSSRRPMLGTFCRQVRDDAGVDDMVKKLPGTLPASAQVRSAARTRAGVKGTRRIRTPVASNTAFATAASIGLQTVSPAP